MGKLWVSFGNIIFLVSFIMFDFDSCMNIFLWKKIIFNFYF